MRSRGDGGDLEAGDSLQMFYFMFLVFQAGESIDLKLWYFQASGKLENHHG